MRSPRHDPLRLDVAAFASDGGLLDGRWSGASLERLADLQVPPQDQGPADVAWQVQGERKLRPGSEAELWLGLSAQARVWLTCQRCLQPMAVDLALQRRLRFVHGESQAAALDADSDDDVLALSRSLDLRELVEDELLLGLPLVPRHDSCPQPLPVSIGLAAGDADEMPPFAPGDPSAVLALHDDPDRTVEAAVARAEDDADAPETLPDGRPNPFAVLKVLKKGGGPGSAGS